VTTNPAPDQPTGSSATEQLAQWQLRYRGRRLDGPIREFHAAVDALEADTVPYTYYAKVLADRGQAPER
jgi:hypothetical protein